MLWLRLWKGRRRFRERCDNSLKEPWHARWVSAALRRRMRRRKRTGKTGKRNFLLTHHHHCDFSDVYTRRLLDFALVGCCVCSLQIRDDDGGVSLLRVSGEFKPTGDAGVSVSVLQAPRKGQDLRQKHNNEWLNCESRFFCKQSPKVTSPSTWMYNMHKLLVRPYRQVSLQQPLSVFTQTLTSWSFWVISGRTLDHSISNSPVSSMPGVYVHPTSAVSPSAIWTVCGPEECTCIAFETSEEAEKYMSSVCVSKTTSLPFLDFHKHVLRPKVKQKQNKDKNMNIPLTCIYILSLYPHFELCVWS